MADTGFIAPGTVISESSVGPKVWITPEEAETSNDVYARCAALRTPDLTEYLWADDFGFAIPVGATIDGIEVTIERWSLGADGIEEQRVYLVKAGSVVGNNYAKPGWWSEVESSYSYGGSSDMWGTTWTPAQVNASNFGVVLRCDVIAGGARVDQFLIKVYYTALSVQINIGDVWKDAVDIQINIGDVWKTVAEVWINIGDVWKRA